MILSKWGAAMGLLICSSIAAHGGTLIEAQMSGQVQQAFNGSELSACGVVIVAIESITGAPTGKVLVFNGSFSIGNLSGGLVKGRASEVDAKRIASGKAGLGDIRPLETTNVWMKAPGAPVTTPMKSVPIQKSDDPGYLIYGSDFESVFALVKAVQSRQPIQIGVRAKGRNFDQALFGTVQMTEAQSSQFDQCMVEWATLMQKKQNPGEPANASGAAAPK